MLTKVAPVRTGKGARKRVITVVDREDWRAGWIVNQLNSRNITQTQLAEMLGVHKNTVYSLIRGKTSAASRGISYYACMYVLTHCWWDEELEHWVVID